jgi:hypothetical protein
VHRGEPCSVRLPAPSATWGRGGWIELCTLDGYWAGGALLDVGSNERRVAVCLQHCGALRVRVSVQGDGDVQGLALGVRALAGGEAPRVVEDRREAFIGFLEPGPYEVAATSRSHFGTAERVLVAPGETAEVDLGIEPAGLAGTLGGTLRTARGVRRPEARVRLRALQEPAVEDTCSVRWREEEGERFGEWTSKELPPGSYELQLAVDDFHAWTGTPRVARPPDPSVDFFCDDANSADLGFLVLDAATGETVRSYVVYWPDGGEWRSGDHADACTMGSDGRYAYFLMTREIAIRAWPLDRPLDWTVSAKGYRLASGTLADFDRTARNPERGRDEPFRYATVVLERGWGADFVVQRDDREPVEGVRIAIGGEPAGATDARGRLRVLRDAATGAVSLDGDWAWESDDLGPERVVPADLVAPIRIVVRPSR